MPNIIDEVAELLYLSDSPALPWDKALPEDRTYYTRVSEMVIDTVADHLSTQDRQSYHGGLSASVEYLRSHSDISKVRRESLV